MKSAKVLLNISVVIAFLYGALYIFSLVFIPIGIYCFIAGKRFSYKAEHMNDLYAIDNKILKNYTIFVCFACFPLGLLAIIPYYLIVSNRVKVSGFKVSSEYEDAKVEEVKAEKEEIEIADSEPKKETAQETVETEEEKIEKFKKLQNFKDKGIITEDELEMAREQLFGKKED